MSFRSSTRVNAEKSERYLASLTRHFARKVPVEQSEAGACVKFDMGTCLMTVSGTCMQFDCVAGSEQALETVKSIVGSHITKYGELQEITVRWSDADS